MKTRYVLFAVFSVVLGMAAIALAQQPPSSSQAHQKHHEGKMEENGKAGQSHEERHADVNRRGDQVMGFDHAKTTHHFRLKPDGGLIEVEANDPQDTASRDQIRQHLRHIAQKFADGDFTAPMLIHDQTPPGVPAMKRLKAEIKYQYEETERGGRVRIATSDEKALAAVHEFLRFQIKDHQTGDSGEVENLR